jgi:hypothetical protein
MNVRFHDVVTRRYFVQHSSMDCGVAITQNFCRSGCVLKVTKQVIVWFHAAVCYSSCLAIQAPVVLGNWSPAWEDIGRVMNGVPDI